MAYISPTQKKEKAIIFTTKEIPYLSYNQKSYRIEIDISNPNITLQRHIWTDIHDNIEVEEWIRSNQETEKSLLDKNYLRKE